MRFKPRYTLAELKSAPTLSVGHTDNLKYQDECVRVWLSRMTLADGMEYNNQVTVEQYYPETGRWETVDEYQAT